MHISFADECCWCKRQLTSGTKRSLTTPEGLKYCTESCFFQSRRASFKRIKMCDWCKHVRHAVNYVDFQDGISQLQFCSDGCLNQYKMQIFCNETQTQLDMNPHLKRQHSKTGTSDALITPELWLKNVRELSKSPSIFDRSRSPTPSSTFTSTSRPLKSKPIKGRHCFTRKAINATTSKLTTKCSNETDQTSNVTPKMTSRRLHRNEFTEAQQSNQQQQSMPKSDNDEPMNRNLFNTIRSMLPSFSVTVPYPILVPIPIPVPIPLEGFIAAAKLKLKEDSRRTEADRNDGTHSLENEPLDFRTNKETLGNSNCEKRKNNQYDTAKDDDIHCSLKKRRYFEHNLRN